MFIISISFFWGGHALSLSACKLSLHNGEVDDGPKYTIIIFFVFYFTIKISVFDFQRSVNWSRSQQFLVKSN